MNHSRDLPSRARLATWTPPSRRSRPDRRDPAALPPMMPGLAARASPGVSEVDVTVDGEQLGTIRCELEMNTDGAVTVTLFDGCAMPEAIDLCRILIDRNDVTRSITVRASRSP